MEQAVLEAGAGDLDILGKLEAQLEGALGNAAMEEFTGLLGRLGSLGALDGQGVFLALDDDVALGEAGHRDRDAVGVIAELLDVVGRVGLGFLADEAVEAVEQPVEADGRAIEGGKIDGLHGHILLVSNVDVAGVPAMLPAHEASSTVPGFPVPGGFRRTAMM